ncbi:MAG: nucleotidyltransferase family protein, partial [Kovacikia sp.]
MPTPEITDIEPLKVIASPEQKLLLCCARTHIDRETSERIKILLSKNLNWQYLFQIAQHHAITPLLYWNLKTVCPETVPPDRLQKLRDFFHFNSQRNLIFAQELIGLMQLFTDQNISALPYKGIILAASAYGNLALRQMADLDILVREKDLSRAMDLLRSRGYELTTQLPWEYHFTKPNSLHNIDLHCPFFSEFVFVFPDPELAWQNLESFSLAGTILPNLTPEMTLLILSLNA